MAAQLRKRATTAQKEIAKGADMLEGPAKEKALRYQKELEVKAKEKARKKVRVEKKVGGGSAEMED